MDMWLIGNGYRCPTCEGDGTVPRSFWNERCKDCRDTGRRARDPAEVAAETAREAMAWRARLAALFGRRAAEEA